MTLLISELMAAEFRRGDWLIWQMAISQHLMHIDMVKGSVNVWLTASFVSCVYGFVYLSRELRMCCTLWTWQTAPSEQSRDFSFSQRLLSKQHCFTFSGWICHMFSIIIICLKPKFLWVTCGSYAKLQFNLGKPWNAFCGVGQRVSKGPNALHTFRFQMFCTKVRKCQ